MPSESLNAARAYGRGKAGFAAIRESRIACNVIQHGRAFEPSPSWDFKPEKLEMFGVRFHTITLQRQRDRGAMATLN